MQTLDRDQGVEPGTKVGNGERRSRTAGVVGVAVLVVAAGAVAYGAGVSQRSTKTIVRTVAAPPAAASSATVNDRGFSELDNGHQAATGAFQQPLTAQQQALLQQQLILARATAMRYPTVADAEAAGWRRAGPFAPGLGAHFFKWTGTGGSGFVAPGPLTSAEIMSPASMIYDGTHPDSRIAGLMYVTSANFYPSGFAGPNDIWHYHSNVCVVYLPNGGIDTPFGADTTVPKSMCDGVRGQLLARTPWMLHVWVVPGYDSPEGIFSHDNEAITCRDGSYHTIPLSDIGKRPSLCPNGSE
jgi:hypothetical protein